ncbi:MAG: TonB-dependent receptor [bacterium]|nr:TonB-dependent receptor [bacterium]
MAGTVTDLGGGPVEDAEVRADGAAKGVRTDQRGRFALPVEPPVVLEVGHPGFETHRLEFDALPDRPLEIVLAPRRGVVREEIAVSANRSQGSYSPQSTAASVLTPEASAGLPSAVAELVAEVPGVSQNGQGGLFQTFSVRGVSRQRVLTLVEGMRIVSERRAGVSASFLDPLLIGSVEVVRGPSSTYWGSGALGGVVQLFPRRFSDLSVVTGYSTEGDERFVRAGYGADPDSEPGQGRWSWGISGRQAGFGKTPGGDPLLSGFEQLSATFARRWSGDRMTYDALVLASTGSDIGKASTDFPDRATTYPSEAHTLFRFAASHESGWRFEAYAHPNELETRVESLGESVSTVDNRALDWGVDFQRELRFSKRRTLRWGVDLFARHDVRSREQVRDPSGRVLVEQQTLSNASEQELGVYGAIETVIGNQGNRGSQGSKDGQGRRGVTLLAGGRLALQSQRNSGFESVDDSAITAFLGAVVPLSEGFDLTANLGTGLRFPSISERFFTGTTGRGFVTGNPDLEPEGSVSADLGLRWTGTTLFVTGSLFRSDIDDYIERIEAAPDRLTFVNLAAGEITGVEIEGAWQASDRWSLSFGGHAMDGEDDVGRTLADVPAHRLYAGWSLEGEPGRRHWRWRARWERRFDKTDIGSGEKAVPEADLVSSSLAWRWRPDLGLRLSASNLLDEEYFNSADQKVPLSAGRSVSLSMEWSPVR